MVAAVRNVLNASGTHAASIRHKEAGRLAALVRFLAVVLLFGVFSIPVSCAQASGPHSMFAPPDGQALAATDPHAHHLFSLRGQVPSKTWAVPPVVPFDPMSMLARSASVDDGVSQVSELPHSDPFLVTSFVIAADSDLVPPQPGSIALMQTPAQRLTGYSEVPDAPPPR